MLARFINTLLFHLLRPPFLLPSLFPSLFLPLSFPPSLLPSLFPSLLSSLSPFLPPPSFPSSLPLYLLPSLPFLPASLLPSLLPSFPLFLTPLPHYLSSFPQCYIFLDNPVGTAQVLEKLARGTKVQIEYVGRTYFGPSSSNSLQHQTKVGLGTWTFRSAVQCFNHEATNHRLVLPDNV